jgi:GT2 family glycosyltransferase
VRRVRPRVASGPVTVTVVVPCYKYGHFLDGVVRSALEQERVRTDVIIVDDASPDGSGEVAEAIAASEPRVSVIRHETNKGHIATYNDGLARATGRYVVLLSADDMLAPGALARATDLMEGHPLVGMVYGIPDSFFTAEPPPPPKRRRSSWSIWPGQQWIDLACWRGRNFTISPEVVVRTEAMREVGLYNPELPHSGDLEYWLRVASLWDVGRINGPVHAHYRVHDANMHLTSFATMLVDLRHRLEAFRVVETLPEPQARPARTRLGWVRRALAREALGIAVRTLDAGGAPESAAALVQFARETWPRIATSRRLRWTERRIRTAGDGVTVAQRGSAAVRRQLDRAAWWTWRAVGVS